MFKHPVVYDRNRYFGFGWILKPKLADTFGRYRNRYQKWTLVSVPEIETEFGSHTRGAPVPYGPGGSDT